jgi:hypothetical protein
MPDSETVTFSPYLNTLAKASVLIIAIHYADFVIIQEVFLVYIIEMTDAVGKQANEITTMCLNFHVIR